MSMMFWKAQAISTIPTISAVCSGLPPPPSEEEFRTFIAEMEPHQVAIGMQSFLSLSVNDIRRIIGA